MPPSNTKNKDFDNRIKNLENNIITEDNVVESFLKSTDICSDIIKKGLSHETARLAINAIILAVIKSDADVRSEIDKRFYDLEQKEKSIAQNQAIKWIGAAVWSVVMLIIGKYIC
jgi:hypothetical protein